MIDDDMELEVIRRENERLKNALLELADQFCATHGQLWMRVIKNRAYARARDLLKEVKARR